MAVLHRALCTWFICLIFLILLVLRLDGRTTWSWFIVFIPMWLYDSILLLYLTLNLVIHCKRPTNRTFHAMRRKIWWVIILFHLKRILNKMFQLKQYIYFFLFRNLTCAILKLVAQIMLCLKLELENSTNHPDFKLPLYYVMIPIWIILPVALVDTFFTMYYQIA